MKIRVGINGFGRIGRLVFRALCEQKHLGDIVEVVAVNDLVGADNLAYLLKYDSVQGHFNGTVEADGEETLVVNGHRIRCLAVKDGPSALPWILRLKPRGCSRKPKNPKGICRLAQRRFSLLPPGKATAFVLSCWA